MKAFQILAFALIATFSFNAAEAQGHHRRVVRHYHHHRVIVRHHHR